MKKDDFFTRGKIPFLALLSGLVAASILFLPVATGAGGRERTRSRGLPSTFELLSPENNSWLSDSTPISIWEMDDEYPPRLEADPDDLLERGEKVEGDNVQYTPPYPRGLAGTAESYELPGTDTVDTYAWAANMDNLGLTELETSSTGVGEGEVSAGYCVYFKPEKTGVATITANIQILASEASGWFQHFSNVQTGISVDGFRIAHNKELTSIGLAPTFYPGGSAALTAISTIGPEAATKIYSYFEDASTSITLEGRIGVQEGKVHSIYSWVGVDAAAIGGTVEGSLWGRVENITVHLPYGGGESPLPP